MCIRDRVSITHNYWLFIDEIQVFKVAETERASKTYSSTAAPENLPVVDDNNLALGAAYETEWPSNMVRPDDNGKLTDGRRASSSYLAKEWVGYTAADGVGAYPVSYTHLARIILVLLLINLHIIALAVYSLPLQTKSPIFLDRGFCFCSRLF